MSTPKTKELKLNGIIVGSIPASENPADEAAAGMKLLKELGLYKETPKASAMFQHAQAFAKLAAEAFAMIGRDTAKHHRMYVPFVVNCAFAIEVYLKTLHALRGKPATGHDLVSLYDSLPDGIKEAVATRFPSHAQERKLDLGTPFRDFLAPMANSFVEWRYAYEDNGPLYFPPHVAIAVIQTLHQTAWDTGVQQQWQAAA